MPLHVATPEGVDTIVRSGERRINYDLPPGAIPKGLEIKVSQNYEAISNFQETIDFVERSGEWNQFMNYLRSQGVSESKIDYLNSEEVNYISGELPRKQAIAGTIPNHSVLTYIVPDDYSGKINYFADVNDLSLDQAAKVIYLHEAYHNVVHDWRIDSDRDETLKEIEVETALEHYFSSRADQAGNESEAEHYQQMADASTKRIGRLGGRKSRYQDDRSPEAIAAFENELSNYESQYDSESEDSSHESEEGESFRYSPTSSSPSGIETLDSEDGDSDSDSDGSEGEGSDGDGE
jgi:hypothetical protein|tara:strand:- start:464 stop:1342 length:879 start_codon:yes stop_codon:yes gene_type:complete